MFRNARVRNLLSQRKLLAAAATLAALMSVVSCGDSVYDEVQTATSDAAPLDGAGLDGIGDSKQDGVADTAKPDIAADVPEVVIDNTPPTLVIVEPKPGFVIQTGDTLGLQVLVSDDATKPEAMPISVLNGATEVCKGLAAADGKFSCVAKDLPAGPLTLLATVTDGNNNEASADVTGLVNTAPGAPVVVIAPLKPTVQDALVASLSQQASDPDRKPAELTYAWSWTRDGVPAANTAELPAGVAKKGELWTATATAKDPYVTGKSASASVVIANSEPQAAELALAPTSVYLTTVVTCDLAKPATDADGEALTSQFTWYVNGVALADPASATLDLKTTKTADGKLIVAGDKLHCSLAVSDGSAVALASSATASIGDVDICATANPCAADGICSNNGSLAPICACKPGFAGDGKSCADIDECLVDNGGCDKNAECSNSSGSFTCTCKGGYSGDGKSCTDVDECLVDNGGCDKNATCSNSDGSSSCACKSGYSGDGKSCSDVDECLVNNGGCDLAAECSNTAGSNTCTCKPGYNGDGLSCVDSDECSLSFDATALTIADDLQGWTVVNSAKNVGWFAKNGTLWYSNPGMANYNSGSANSGTAVSPNWLVPANVAMALSMDVTLDVEGGTTFDLLTIELAAGATPVVVFEKDVESPGGKQSVHLDIDLAAYAGKQIQLTFKFDTVDDEVNNTAGIAVSNLKLTPRPCGANATCSNSVGSFTCSCDSGYSGDGQNCTDIDECASNNGGCDKNAACSNSPGSFSCSCKTYWSGDGKTCSDIDECASNNGGCGAVGAYKCTNNAGAAPTCSDIDECAAGTANCSANANCTNSVGSFACSCKPGFFGNGTTCSDINECQTSQIIAATDWTFSGSSTSVKWQVKGSDLYYGNPLTNNYNSGSANKGSALSSQVAVPPAGGTLNFALVNNVEAGTSFDKLSLVAVLPDGSTVLLADKAKLVASPLPSVFSISLAAVAGKTVQFRFDFDTVDGSGNSTSGVLISNVFALFAGTWCDANATCSNTTGSFSCACKTGFSGNGKTCSDIDECATNNGGCGAATAYKCSNNVGGAPTCSDINECLTNNGGCDTNATCSNTVGSFSCACKPFWTGNGKTCSDIDECATNNGGCGAATAYKCSNNVGGAPTCSDINECLTNNGGCDANATCTNSTGSFTCACKTGYVGDGKTCAAPGSSGNPGKDCKSILAIVPGAASGLYVLDPDGSGGAAAYTAHCEMKVSDGATAGGWSLAMKVDGTKTTFVYASPLWTNASLLNANLPGVDTSEAKLQTFNGVPVTQILVRMVVEGVTRDLVVPVGGGKTLAQLFQGAAVNSAVGRTAWKGLIGPKASLQPYCSSEGINRVCGGDTAIRIGIVSNQENDCGSCDSRIGVGATGTYCGQDPNNSAGNEARCSPDNGDLSLKGFAYIYVR